MEDFSHFNEHGRARMVDVSEKADTVRMAVAYGRVLVNEETFRLIQSGGLKKGDVLTTAQIGGIMCLYTGGENRPFDWLPLCRDELLALLPPGHPLTERDAVPIEAFQNEQFIMPLAGYDYEVHHVLDRLEHYPHIRFSACNDYAIISLVTAGLGVSILPELLLRNYQNDAVAMFPFHLWLPDAHGGATTSSSAILSGLVLKGYIVLLITLMTRVFGLQLMRKVGVSNILLTLGLLGMIFGSLAAMREYHVLRFLCMGGAKREPQCAAGRTNVSGGGGVRGNDAAGGAADALSPAGVADDPAAAGAGDSAQRRTIRRAVYCGNVLPGGIRG